MDHPTWIGRTLGGRYRIDALLGQGGMSAVYKATDPNLKRVVAIKLIHSHLSSDPSFVYRFEGEASAVANLRHPNIVQIYDFNHDGGVYYMVLEFIPGETLQDRLTRLNNAGRFLSLEEVLKITVNICDAIGYAHQRGMIHRDIKPANIMLDVHSQAILMDFGIVKILGGESHTSTGAVVGTARYMCPEIIRGEVADQRSDIYSLGVTLYEMLGGRPPFIADSAMTLMMMHLNDPIPDIHEFHADIPNSIVDVVKKALQKERGNRYQSAGEMSADLRRILAYIEREAVEHQTAISNAEREAAEKVDREKDDYEFVETAATKLKIEQVEAEKAGLEAVPGKAKTVQPVARLPMGIMRYALIGFIGLFVIATGIWGLSSLTSLSAPTQTAIPATSTLTPTAILTPTKTFTPTITFTPTPFPLEITDAKGVVMRLIPAGEFTMGSNSGNPDEQPIHTVNLSAFYMDKYEVTNALYKACVEAGACSLPQNTRSSVRSSYYGNTEFDNYPVVYVDWNMAKTYCEWRSAQLPTEAQWEKAARGTDERTYPWGEGIDCKKANHNYSGNDFCVFDTSAVGSYEGGQSPYGMYEMAGNVWEWTADWYSETYYQTLSDGVLDPQGPENGEQRAVRGGSWRNAEDRARTTARNWGVPTINNDRIGFRCVSSLP